MKGGFSHKGGSCDLAAGLVFKRGGRNRGIAKKKAFFASWKCPAMLATEFSEDKGNACTESGLLKGGRRQKPKR